MTLQFPSYILMFFKNSIHQTTIFIVLVVSLISPANADPVSKEENKWEFSVAPYLWMANISGSQTVKGKDVDLDVGFGDVIEVLDFAAELHAEALKNNTWGLFLDGTYLKLGPEVNEGPVNIRVNYQYWMAEFGGFYRANTWNTGYARVILDLILGGRYTSMDTEIDFRNSPVPTKGGSEAWTDVIGGARVIVDLSDEWAVALRGDVGGGSSNLAVQGNLLINYHFNPNWTLMLGARALYQDYETGEGANKFAYHGTTYGPLLGAEYRF